MITASMSTIAWREPGLSAVVAAILPQVHRLNVFLQGYSDVPACLRDDRVSVLRDVDAPESAALGASAKFHWLWHELVADGYHFQIDDDIQYPPDYVIKCVKKIDEYGRKAIVGFHGAIYQPKMRQYFRDRKLWSYEASNDVDRFVHILGTGTASFHTSALKLTRDDFAQGNSCDLYLGIACQKQRVPVVCLWRPKGYLKSLPLASDPRSCSGPEEYARRMVKIHDTWSPWTIHAV